jgi:hypothetical protein
MDRIAQYNQARWAALARNNAIFTRPYLNLNRDAARELVDPEGHLGDLRGQRVLCLASGVASSRWPLPCSVRRSRPITSLPSPHPGSSSGRSINR